MTDPVRATLRVASPLGLHARPCAAIARAVAKSRSRVTLRRGEHHANAASILDLLTLAARAGDTLEVVVEGTDAATVLELLRVLLEIDGAREK